MEIVDKGIDPNDSSKCILELNMSEKEAAQIDALTAEIGGTIEEYIVNILTQAVQNPKQFAEQCARISSNCGNEQRNEG